MGVTRLHILGAAAAVCGALAAGSVAHGQSRPPTMVLSGGGGLRPTATDPVLRLAGGADAVVAVLFHREIAGANSVDLWKRAGAAAVHATDVRCWQEAREDLDRATLLWFAGGSQTELMNAIGDTGLAAYVNRRFHDGVVVGGGSAGAAVFAELMTTGDADVGSLTVDRTKTAAGLGIWPAVVLDQHFLKRQRMNRFLSLVLDHPDRIGVAIDEGTALLVEGRRATVLGSSNVVIVDAQRADVPQPVSGQPSAGRNIAVHVLRHGDTFDFGDRAPP